MSRARRQPGAAREPVDPAVVTVDDALRERLAELGDLAAADVVVRGGDLSGLPAARVELRRVLIEHTRLMGADATRGAFTDVTVRGASVQLGLLAEADVTRVTFESCDLRETTFAAARLQDVLFVDCRLDGADFREARARNCALRGCTLDGAEGLGCLLAGASMPWPDVVASAGALAAALGLTISD